jgi:hypothetical protein
MLSAWDAAPAPDASNCVGGSPSWKRSSAISKPASGRMLPTHRCLPRRIRPGRPSPWLRNPAAGRPVPSRDIPRCSSSAYRPNASATSSSTGPSTANTARRLYLSKPVAAIRNRTGIRLPNCRNAGLRLPNTRQLCWLWVAATSHLSVFLIHSKRGLEGLWQLLGTVPTGILCSDRWSAYNSLEPRRRQVCLKLGRRRLRSKRPTTL